MTEVRVAGKTELSEAELSELINATSRDDVLPLTFGGNRVWLQVDKASQPILQKLAELRGLTS